MIPFNLLSDPFLSGHHAIWSTEMACLSRTSGWSQEQRLG